MQVRRVGRRVASRPDIADDVALRDALAIAQACRVPLKVGVVVAELFGGIELVDGDPASLAVEEPGDGAVLDRDDRRVPRREDVDRFVPSGSAAAALCEVALPVVDIHVDVVIVDRQPQVVPPKNSDRIGADRLASDRRLDHARRVGRHGPGRLAGRFVDVTAGCGDGRFGMRLADRRANPPARRHAGVEAGDERGNDTPAAASLRAHLKITGVPGATSAASRAASQLVRRTQPCDCVCPTFEGSGVPWMP